MLVIQGYTGYWKGILELWFRKKTDKSISKNEGHHENSLVSRRLQLIDKKLTEKKKKKCEFLSMLIGEIGLKFVRKYVSR